METNRPSTTLIKKKRCKSKIWKYFSFAADGIGNIVKNNKPACKRCRRVFITKSRNTSSLIKHLKD